MTAPKASEGEPAKVWDVDAEQKSRVKFMITDISKGSKKVLVRDVNGALRDANVTEKWGKKYGKVKEFFM